jgi:hypothetical protein
LKNFEIPLELNMSDFCMEETPRNETNFQLFAAIVFDLVNPSDSNYYALVKKRLKEYKLT